MNQHVNDLLDKEVSRKEFLGICGLAVASLFGFGTLVKFLLGKQASNHSMVRGYGSNTYGR